MPLDRGAYVHEVGRRLQARVFSRRGLATLTLSLFILNLATDGVRDAAGQPSLIGWVVAGSWLGVLLLANAWESDPEVLGFAERSGVTHGSPKLRRDGNATLISDRGGFLFERRHFFTATTLPPVRISTRRLEQLRALQTERPVQIASSEHRRWWWFRDAFYWEDADYSPEDVRALVVQRERRHRRRLERAHTELALEDGASSTAGREPIPRPVRRHVYERDGGACIQCGSGFELQYDHVIPVAKGGATTPENLQLLCRDCNQAKGDDV